MYAVITIIHVLTCLFLIAVVLLQQGKGADMGAVFGGSSQTLFGSSGAGNFLTRLTTGMAVMFMVTSLTLAYGSARRVTSTIFDDAPLPDAPLSAPQAPAPEGASEAAPPAAPQEKPEAPGEAPPAQGEPQAQAAPPVEVISEAGEAMPAQAAARAEARSAEAAAPAEPEAAAAQQQ